MLTRWNNRVRGKPFLTAIKLFPAPNTMLYTPGASLNPVVAP